MFALMGPLTGADLGLDEASVRVAAEFCLSARPQAIVNLSVGIPWRTAYGGPCCSSSLPSTLAPPTHAVRPHCASAQRLRACSHSRSPARVSPRSALAIACFVGHIRFSTLRLHQLYRIDRLRASPVVARPLRGMQVPRCCLLVAAKKCG